MDGAAGVSVRATGSGAERRAGFSGLAVCGSVWACAVCSAKILAGRAGELSTALEAWTAGGGRVAMVTLTMRHREGQSLRELWDGIGYAWGQVTSGRAWESTQETYGALMPRTVTRGKRKGLVVVEKRVGWVRVVEVTHGANGWHVHVHAALMLPGSTTARDVDDLGCLLFQRWRDALQRKGFAAPLARRGGLDAKLWDGATGQLGDYFAKVSYDADATKLAVELARGDIKEARSGNRTPFRILADVLALGVVDDWQLWREWEKASKGKRQLTWSVGLRELLLPDVVELTDEELAEAAELAGSVLVVITAKGWRVVAKCQLVAAVLERAEVDDDGQQLRAWLTKRGVEWRDPEPDA